MLAKQILFNKETTTRDSEGNIHVMKIQKDQKGIIHKLDKWTDTEGNIHQTDTWNDSEDNQHDLITTTSIDNQVTHEEYIKDKDGHIYQPSSFSEENQDAQPNEEISNNNNLTSQEAKE